MVSKQYKQTISGSAGDIFTFGGWAKAATVPLDSASMETRTDYPRRAGIAVTLYNGTNAARSDIVRRRFYFRPVRRLSRGILRAMVQVTMPAA